MLEDVHIRIKQLRQDSGKNQEEFALSIGVGRSNYAQIEAGNQLPTLKTLQNIVRNYGTTYSWLIEGELHKTASVAESNHEYGGAKFLLKRISELEQRIKAVEDKIK